MYLQKIDFLRTYSPRMQNVNHFCSATLKRPTKYWDHAVIFEAWPGPGTDTHRDARNRPTRREQLVYHNLTYSRDCEQLCRAGLAALLSLALQLALRRNASPHFFDDRGDQP
jgi:hypothetical protein